MRPDPVRGARPGSAYVLATILLAVFAALAVGLASEANLGLKKAGNQTQADLARLEAESGMAYFSHILRQASLPAGATGQAVLDGLAGALQDRLDGTDTLAGQTVGYDGATIAVPMIGTADQRGFSGAVSLNQDGTVRLTVTGQRYNCTRRLGMNFQVVAGRSAVCDYGVASRSKITLSGNARIMGENDDSEASVLSATYSDPEAVGLTGNCRIAGDVSVSNPDGYISMAGNVTIAGLGAADPEIFDHLHVGVGGVEFPRADPSVFEPFATDVVDCNTPTSGNKTFTNIRILAHTNPTFSGNITLEGVVFIETPNRVTFSGNLVITGVVVTQDAGDGCLDDNYLHFTGNTSTTGVGHLPDDPEFAGLKELPGTFLLAPGFSVKLGGNFGTINGTIAADEFQYSGNARGTIHGWVINWGDTELAMTGNARLTIDRGGLDELPSCFVVPSRLSPVPETYEEF